MPQKQDERIFKIQISHNNTRHFVFFCFCFISYYQVDKMNTVLMYKLIDSNERFPVCYRDKNRTTVRTQLFSARRSSVQRSSRILKKNVCQLPLLCIFISIPIFVHLLCRSLIIIQIAMSIINNNKKVRLKFTFNCTTGNESRTMYGFL